MLVPTVLTPIVVAQPSNLSANFLLVVAVSLLKQGFTLLLYTGCFAGTEKKYWSIAQARKHPWAYYQGAKVH
jgi:xanthine/uracil permease